MAKRIKAPKSHCCGADLPPWQMAEGVDEYHIPAGTVVTLIRLGRRPNDKYKLKLKAPTGGNPCPKLRSMVMIPVQRNPPSEISFDDLLRMVASWNGDFLKATYDIISSKHDYKIGVGRVDGVPTSAVFIQSKYDGCPGHCRTFALVLKKLAESSAGKPKKTGPIGPRILQGGVLHGTEN